MAYIEFCNGVEGEERFFMKPIFNSIFVAIVFLIRLHASLKIMNTYLKNKEYIFIYINIYMHITRVSVTGIVL